MRFGVIHDHRKLRQALWSDCVAPVCSLVFLHCRLEGVTEN